MKTNLSRIYGKRVTPNVKLTFVITILLFGVYAACSSESDHEYSGNEITNEVVIEQAPSES